MRALSAAGAIALSVGLVGCADSSADQSATAPPCDGVATSDFGLGNAVHAAVPALAALPVRFSTGDARVKRVADSDSLIVEVHLCAPDASVDETRDAASAVAREVAAAPMLGTDVAQMIVENPPASQRITADPFEPAVFTAAADVDTLRSQWLITER
ncbi:hypothetical protein [Gordonia phthalatica]|uniref:hypothetical protein n=1 Tax=Gordonia phthalatica TaxID=1136941 RepID=UPI0012FE8280|nr:hypothetical protein [Gordonia phthalatica]